MNSKNWKFVKEGDILFEKASGRVHYWHYHPETLKEADSYMVKVVVPEGGGHNFHVHPEMNEILYVLKGKAEQWIEDEMHILGEGESVYIDADVAHATYNAGEGELEFLAILSPPEGWEAGTVDVSSNLPYSEYRQRI